MTPPIIALHSLSIIFIFMSSLFLFKPNLQYNTMCFGRFDLNQFDLNQDANRIEPKFLQVQCQMVNNSTIAPSIRNLSPLHRGCEMWLSRPHLMSARLLPNSAAAFTCFSRAPPATFVYSPRGRRVLGIDFYYGLAVILILLRSLTISSKREHAPNGVAPRWPRSGPAKRVRCEPVGTYHVSSETCLLRPCRRDTSTSSGI